MVLSGLTLLALGCKSQNTDVPARSRVAPTSQKKPIKRLARRRPAPQKKSKIAQSSRFDLSAKIKEDLRKEAARRPTGTIRVEQVLDSLGKGGIKIKKVNQALGSIVGADYCINSATGNLLLLTICEYRDPHRAADGKKRVIEMFGSGFGKNFYIAVNKATMITLTKVVQRPADQSNIRNILKIFREL